MTETKVGNIEYAAGLYNGRVSVNGVGFNRKAKILQWWVTVGLSLY